MKEKICDYIVALYTGNNTIHQSLRSSAFPVKESEILSNCISVRKTRTYNILYDALS